MKSGKHFVSIFIFLCIVLLLDTSIADAQIVQHGNFHTAVVMNGKVSFAAPGKFKKIKKKQLIKFNPYHQDVEAVGLTCGDKSEILFYKTGINWNHDDNGIQIWQLASQVAKTFDKYTFLETGYYEHETSSAAIYFMKVSFKDDDRTVYALLTFSVLEDKVLYGLFLNTEDINTEWANSIQVTKDTIQYTSRKDTIIIRKNG